MYTEVNLMNAMVDFKTSELNPKCGSADCSRIDHYTSAIPLSLTSWHLRRFMQIASNAVKDVYASRRAVVPRKRELKST